MLLRKGSAKAASEQERLIARHMIARADAARDMGQYRDAALLYAEALRLTPDNAGAHIQCGNMFKDCGEHATAEAHYLQAAALRPDDADLALQLGHLYKSAGRAAEARRAYVRALTLKPGWNQPTIEIDRLSRAGLREPADDQAPAGDVATQTSEVLRRDHENLAMEAVPRPWQASLHHHHETIDLRRLGQSTRTHWGIMPTLRGVEALRGFCVSATPIVEIQLLLNGQLIYRGAPHGGYALKHERDDDRLRKYVFNIWFDFSDFALGRYSLEYRAIDTQRRMRSRHETIVVAAPLDVIEYEDCDGVVAPPVEGRGLLDAQINTAPSMIRPGARALLKEAPRAILIQRMDQLGDVVVSVPALRRLREILPKARLVGLLSPANAELAASLELFDEIIIVDFADDPWERRRIMSAEAQEALRERLAPYRFDMAIDLAENASSRPLLALSGAPFLYGFPSGDMPSLRSEMSGFTHDPWNRHEMVPHTSKLMGLVEWLAAMLTSHSRVVRRQDLDPSLLAAFGLAAGDKFAVLHDGARLQFSRWPHYTALAAMLLEQTNLKIVMLTDSPATRETLPADLADADRFQLIDRRLAFDQFDALLSYCSLFVGNDSGPKHLAALRGAKVVSVHMARNNWNEWGQENGGYIVSRRVPCSGCLVWHDAEECGKDFVCIRGIKPEEVMSAALRLL